MKKKRKRISSFSAVYADAASVFFVGVLRGFLCFFCSVVLNNIAKLVEKEIIK